MKLAPGTRLDPYEIVAPLGAGGMGEVYRAHDTKLNRDIAVKVLPDSLASDPERLARFSREAQVLASLNHPNIAHIHGFEDSTGVPALVIELVEGPMAGGEFSGAIDHSKEYPFAAERFDDVDGPPSERFGGRRAAALSPNRFASERSDHRNLEYSDRACLRIGISGSASFQSMKKSS